MYFIMNDYKKNKNEMIGVYVDALPIEFGKYDSIRVTCVDTGECIISRSIPIDNQRRTPTMLFKTNGLDQYQFIAEYKMIGDGDYTYIGTVVLFYMEWTDDDERIDGMELPQGNGQQLQEIDVPPIIIEEVM